MEQLLHEGSVSTCVSHHSARSPCALYTSQLWDVNRLQRLGREGLCPLMSPVPTDTPATVSMQQRACVDPIPGLLAPVSVRKLKASKSREDALFHATTRAYGIVHVLKCFAT